MSDRLAAALVRIVEEEPKLGDLDEGRPALSDPWESDGEGFLRIRDVDGSLLIALHEELPSTSLYGACREMLIEDQVLGPNVGKLVGDAMGTSLFDSDRFLMGLLVDASRFRDRQLRIQDLLDSARRLFLDRSAPRRIMAPLPAEFDTESGADVALPFEMSLRKLPEEDILSAVRAGMRFRNIPDVPGHVFVGKGWGVEVRFHLPLVVSEPASEPNASRSEAIEAATRLAEAARVRVLNFFVALRLGCAGPISPVGIVEIQDDPFMGGRSMSFNNRRFPRPPRDDYLLTVEQEAQLPERIRQIASDEVSMNPALGTALKRFSSSTVRHDDEDRLLDLVIAAEALFAGEGAVGDLSLRVSQRFARYLEGTGAETVLELFQHMRTAYIGRSQLVHAQKRTAGVERKIATAAGVLDETEDLMRRALVMALRTTSTSGDFAPDWDRLVLVGHETEV